jgi:predicted metal-dependent peptidase
MDAQRALQNSEFVTAVDSPLRLAMVGGGGTNFSPPFEWVEEEAVQPVGLVYFTDLAGAFPVVEPDYPVLWLNYGMEEKAPFGETVSVR